MSTASMAGSPARARARRSGAPPSLLLAAVPAAIGVLLVVLGWSGASGEAAFDDQTTPLNVAILGALVVIVGCGFYLFAFRRRIARRVTVLRTATLGAEGED